MAKPDATAENEMIHVDDFADRCTPGQSSEVKYARWFFFLKRLAAVYQHDWKEQIAQYKLFCTYEGKRYRVTGASRMGDVWLATDFNRETGYDLRVDLGKCSAWSPLPQTHNYVASDVAEWSDTYTCTKCGNEYTYAAEDGMSASRLNSRDLSECVSKENSSDRADQADTN